MKKLISLPKTHWLERVQNGESLLVTNLMIGYGLMVPELLDKLPKLNQSAPCQTWINPKRWHITVAAHRAFFTPESPTKSVEKLMSCIKSKIALKPKFAAITDGDDLILHWEDSNGVIEKIRDSFRYMNAVPKLIHTTLMYCTDRVAFKEEKAALAEAIKELNIALKSAAWLTFLNIRTFLQSIPGGTGTPKILTRG